MRILFLTPWFPAHKHDQMGNFILDSVESLVNLGHTVIILVSESWKPKIAGLFCKDWIKKKVQVEEFSDKFNLYFCHYFSIPRAYLNSMSIYSYRKNINPMLKKLVIQYQCHLIHAHTEISGVSAVDVGSELGIPTVITLHGISTERKLYSGKSKKLLFEYTLRNANCVILVGNALMEFGKQFVNNIDNFRVVPNGFRHNLYNSITYNKSWLDNHLRFISVSNLHEGKGIEINLYALAKLKNTGVTKWTYKIIGAGDQKKYLQALVIELDLSKQVSFLGACSHDEVYNNLSQADIFTLPSYREAFGVAYTEAMSCGLLTIGVKGQGPQDFIEHGKTGFLVPPKDVDALSSLFKKICASRDNMREIAEAGKKYIHNNFTWKNHAISLLKVYCELVKDSEYIQN